MKDYYEILEVPVTATREEIKSQYRQLVRTYHPDRFRDANDKVQAEEKLKQINIAFQVLSGKAVQTVAQDASKPRPVAYPPNLDFGNIPPGTKSTLSLQVNNLGADANNVALRFSGDSRVFHISKGKRVYADRAFPLNYAVSANANRSAPDSAHRGWLEIDLDGAITHVELSLRINASPPRQLGEKRRFQFPKFSLSKRWAVVLLVIFLFGLLGAALPVVAPQFTAARFLPAALFARPFYALQSDDLLFAVQEKDIPVLYTSDATGQSLNPLGIGGRAAVGSEVSQQVAYLGSDEDVYIVDLKDGQHQPLTQDGEPKTALTWSPDGTRLAYLIGEPQNAHIVVHDLALSQQYTLPGAMATDLVGVTGGVDHYAWSPTGDVILFDLWQGTERRVYRIGINGRGLQQLTHFDSWGGAWSADGQALVVSSPQGIYRLDAQGQKLNLISEVTGESPSWSPDGKWLAYLAHAAGGARQTLWIMEMASGQTTRVADESVSYAWSSTGDLLAYVTGRTTTDPPLFYLWTVTPGESTQLIAEVTDPIFDWAQ